MLTRCHYVLSYADRLRRVGGTDNFNNHSSRTLLVEQDGDLQSKLADNEFHFPVNISLFTLRQPNLSDGDQLVHCLLCDLHYTLSIAVRSQKTPPSSLRYYYIVSIHEQLFPYIIGQDRTSTDTSTLVPGPTSLEVNDSRITPLRLAIFILTSWVLFSSGDQLESQSLGLANLASRLRVLLSSTVSGLHINANWMPYPGALMWCHAIGVRFAGLQCDRTWFMMHFLRLAQLSTLESWEEASKSIHAIVSGLEQIMRVSLKPR